MGWRPETEWSGPENRKPQRFLSADEYIKRVETEVPVLRERLRFYDDQVVKSSKHVEELSGTIKEQGEALKELLSRTKVAEQRGYERAIAEKQAEMRAAVASADTAAYAKAEAEARAINDARVKAMQPPAPQQKPAAQPQVHPETTAWLAQNEWFNRDRVLNAAAIEAYEVVTRETCRPLRKLSASPKPSAGCRRSFRTSSAPTQGAMRRHPSTHRAESALHQSGQEHSRSSR
jgi:hypothetical protein